MVKQETRNPTVIIPYTELSENEGCQDVFIYLRPESNGIKVESTLFSIIKNTPIYRNKVKIAYLANIPGDFIVRNRIIEQHYHLKLSYAKKGKKLFTPKMKEVFESYFQTDFEDADILGSFEAMRKHKYSWNELFNLYVPAKDILVINGQSIKRINNRFILNYDIPALLHKNNYRTDIAVMIFRTGLSKDDFIKMIDDMHHALIEEKILSPENPVSRIFHFSKGPFEQILDAVGFLYDQQKNHIGLEKILFCSYLIKNGLTLHDIHYILKYPVFMFRDEQNKLIENDIYTYTAGDRYVDAYRKIKNAVGQFISG